MTKVDAARSDRLATFTQRFAAREREVTDLELRKNGVPRLAPPLAPAACPEGSALLAAVRAENEALRRRLDAIEAGRRAVDLVAADGDRGAPAARARIVAADALDVAPRAPAAPEPAALALAPAVPPAGVARCPSDEDRRSSEDELRRSREQSARRRRRGALPRGDAAVPPQVRRAREAAPRGARAARDVDAPRAPVAAHLRLALGPPWSLFSKRR